MATVNDKYVVVGQPDGFTDQNVVRSRVFKKTVENFGTVNDGDTLDNGVNYAVAKFPAGFIPRSVVVNVIEGDGKTTEAGAAATNVTVSAAKDVTNLSNATVTAVKANSTVAFKDAGQTLIDITTPWITGKNDYLVVSATADVNCKFEVVCIGDWPELAGVPHLPKVA